LNWKLRNEALKVVNDLAQKDPHLILPRAEALGYGFFSKPNIVIISYLTVMEQRPGQKKQIHFIQEVSLIQITAKV